MATNGVLLINPDIAATGTLVVVVVVVEQDEDMNIIDRRKDIMSKNIEYRIQNIEYRIQNIEYRIQNIEYRIDDIYPIQIDEKKSESIDKSVIYREIDREVILIYHQSQYG